MTQLHPFSTRLTSGLIAHLEAAEASTGLGVQVLLRLALERGLPIVEAQLASSVKVSAIELPPRVIEDAKFAKMRRGATKGSK